MLKITKKSSTKPKWNELALISGSISKLYKEGIIFNHIFELLEELPISKEYKDALIKVKKAVNNGQSLSKGFSMEYELFPSFFIAMIDIGEKTGRISEVLDGLNLFYSKMGQIRKTIIDSLTYPIILLIAMIAIVIFLMIFIIPSFVDVYKSMGKELPRQCEIIIELKEKVGANPMSYIIKCLCWFIITPMLLFKYFFKDKIKLFVCNLPIYKTFSEYMIIMLLAVILKSGVNISKGLGYCNEIKISKSINGHIQDINKKILAGETLYSSMFSIAIFSRYTLAHVKLGEEGGGLENVLVTVEQELFNNMQGSLKKKVAMIQPMMIIFMGLMVVVFIVLFILPIFNSLMSGNNI